VNIARTLNLNAGLGRAAAVILAAGLFCGAMSYADNPPVPSKHQMMKDCMAKQKASEAGRSREDMRNSCKDVTKTEKQNADKASSTTQEANRG
jgi:hypothetical protein